MWKTQFLRVKSSLFKLEKDFIDLKGIGLKDGEINIKREIEKLFFKPIFVSIEDKNRFEKKQEMKKIKPVKTFCMNG